MLTRSVSARGGSLTSHDGRASARAWGRREGDSRGGGAAARHGELQSDRALTSGRLPAPPPFPDRRCARVLCSCLMR